MPKGIPPMESTIIWLKMNVLPNKEMGWNDLSGSALKFNLKLSSTVKYLDGISDGLGCVSQH
jgi:hypothetical protein